MNFQAKVICCRCLARVTLTDDELVNFDNCIEESQRRFTFMWCGSCGNVLSAISECSKHGSELKYRRLAH